MVAEFEKLQAHEQRAVHAYVREIMMEIGIELKAMPLPAPPVPDAGTQADIERRVQEAVDARVAAILEKANAGQPISTGPSDEDLEARLDALLEKRLATANANPPSTEGDGN